MIYTIFILSITVAALLVLVVYLTAVALDLRARAEQLNDMLREKEDNFLRANDLVYKKFGYRVPMSEKYLSIAEILLEKELSQNRGEQCDS